MTDHCRMGMRHADRQVKEKELIKAMLDLCPVCTLAMHDEPYPYEVPLNFGYIWEDKLTLYMHMAAEGYKADLLRKNPYVCCNAFAFVDRSQSEPYRNERQDYRSVTVFGKAEVLSCEQPEELLVGLNALQAHYKRKPLDQAPASRVLRVIKLTADAVTAKAQYPISEMEEVAMPEKA